MFCLCFKFHILLSTGSLRLNSRILNQIKGNDSCISETILNKNIAGGANARLQLLLENSKSENGHNYVKMFVRATWSTCMGSPFDSKQLV